jgi:hypothetical protein
MLNWLIGGGLSGVARELRGAYRDRLNATNDADRIRADERIATLKGEAEVMQSYYANRASWMQAGGFWLLLMFAAPVAVWHAAVIMDSLPYVRDLFGDRQVHALPAPLDEWAGWIVIACIGGAGAFAWKK